MVQMYWNEIFLATNRLNCFLKNRELVAKEYVGIHTDFFNIINHVFSLLNDSSKNFT